LLKHFRAGLLPGAVVSGADGAGPQPPQRLRWRATPPRILRRRPIDPTMPRSLPLRLRLSPHRTGLLALAALTALTPPAALAGPLGGTGPDDDALAPPVQSRVLRTRLGLERVHLPQGERMGLAGLSALVQVDGDWWAGPAVYGAASGQRGGLFVPGVELAWARPVSEHFALDAGLFAGGGGGAAAPVGNGLMLRPHLDLVWRGPGFYTGPTLSWVHFGGGQIRSFQPGWMLTLDSSLRVRPPGNLGGSRGVLATGLGFDTVVATATVFQPQAGNRNRDGQPLENRIGLVGIRAERHPFVDGPWWGIEAAGAASGGVAGYAEVLGTMGLSRLMLDDRLEVGGRVATGLAGGGGLDTGGGLLAKGSLGLKLKLSQSLAVSAEAGRTASPRGHLAGRAMQLGLDWQLDDRRAAAPGTSPADATPVTTEWVAGDIRYPALRKDGSRRPLQAVTLAVNRFVTPTLYLSGQAHSAWGGGAGAYSVGLFGLGAQWPLGDAGRWRVGAEALAGAAGGGGVDTQGGAILQGRVYGDLPLTPALDLRLGLGRVRSVQGGLSGNSLDAALVWRFSVDAPARRRGPTAGP